MKRILFFMLSIFIFSCGGDDSVDCPPYSTNAKLVYSHSSVNSAATKDKIVITYDLKGFEESQPKFVSVELFLANASGTSVTKTVEIVDHTNALMIFTANEFGISEFSSPTSSTRYEVYGSMTVTVGDFYESTCVPPEEGYTEIIMTP